jgi:hydrogenase nickel incorporation protein HypA/HybF
MHEIGVLYEAIKVAEKTAEENSLSEIKCLTLSVGELTGYLPVFFEKYFPIIIEDRPLFQDAELKLEIVPGEALCSQCQSIYNVMKCKGVCPKCGSRNKTVLGGQEFLIKNIIGY